MNIKSCSNSKAESLKPEQAEFQRRVNKLVKHGALEVSMDESGECALVPRIKARAPRTDPAKAAFGKLGVGGVQVVTAGTNGAKAALGAVDIADKHSSAFNGGHMTEGLSAGVNVANGLAYGAAGAFNIAKLHAACETDQSNMAMAAQYAQGAHLFMKWGGKKGGEADYCQFCKYTEPVFGQTGHRSSSSLDKQVYGLNIPRYFANMGASVASLVGSLAKLGHVASANLTVATTFSTTVTTTVATTVAAVASGVTAGVLGIVAAGCEAGVAYAQDKKARREVRANKRTGARLKKWDEDQYSKIATTQNATHPGLDAATARATSQERQRRLKSHARTRTNAKVSYAKATVATLVTVTSLALLFTVSVATAGIAVGVLAGLFAAGCLTYGVIQTRRELEAARETKRSQRQARTLMVTHSIDDIKRMMRSEGKDKDKCGVEVVTYERTGFFSRKKTPVVRTVDVRDNGYLSVEIWAHDLAVSFSRLDWKDERTRHAAKALCSLEELTREEEKQLGEEEVKTRKAAIEEVRNEAGRVFGDEAVKILSRLKAAGMTASLLEGVCQQALTKLKGPEDSLDPNGVERRSALLRPHMAAAEKFGWTPEKPVHPTVFMGSLEKILKDEKFVKDPITNDYEPKDYLEIASAFRRALGRQAFKKFDRSLQGLPPEDGETETLRIARRLPLYAELHDRKRVSHLKIFMEQLDKILTEKSFAKNPVTSDYEPEDYLEIANALRTVLGNDGFKEFDRSLQALPPEGEEAEDLRIARRLPLYAELHDRKQVTKSKANERVNIMS